MSMGNNEEYTTRCVHARAALRRAEVAYDEANLVFRFHRSAYTASQRELLGREESRLRVVLLDMEKYR